MQRLAQLFPEIEPIKKGHHYTSDGHAVYYELCGNPKGKPITFVPGGPGCGLEPENRRFFDPERWSILLVELRGSGNSQPSGKIEANTTALAAKDIHDINHLLGRSNTVLFGGSWGSTLALYYAINYPQTVIGIVLRGIFLGEKDETAYYLSGKAATSEYGKKANERFLSHVTNEWKHDPIGYYYHNMKPAAPRHRRMHYSYEWIRYEVCLFYNKPRDESEVEAEIRSCNYETWALIEAHYFANNCFMGDKYIINNAGKIPDVPIVIVQGKEDMICPPINALRLHEALPKSKLFLIEGGHSSREPETSRTLLSETDAMYDMI